MPGFTERERATLAEAFKEAGVEASALPDSPTVIPFTKGVRQTLIHGLFGAINVTIEAAKAYAKELNDAQCRRASLNAYRLERLENRVRELEQKAN